MAEQERESSMSRADRPLDLRKLLESALPPIDPPADLETRLESALEDVTHAASEELADWELAAMRDPRNWARPAIAVTAGAMAGAALFLLRQQRRQRQPVSARDRAQRVVKDAVDAASDVRSRLKP